jgi:hypothetical protein
MVSLALASGMAASFACTGDVAIVAQLDNPEGGDPTPLKELEVRALPYNRDMIFDSLTNAAGSPAPAAPDSLVALQSQIAQAQNELSLATERWNGARDSLRAIRNRMDQLNRQSAEYRLLFADFGDQEDRERAARAQMDGAFRRFDDLQKRYTNAAQEYRIMLAEWEDQAFVAVDSVIAQHIEESGREEVWDTTDANGVLRMTLKRGEWWIYSRYDLPFDELYWNLPVEVSGGEPKQVQLNNSTAQRRPKY